MKKKTFNPAEWQTAKPAKQTALPAKNLPEREIGGASDLETIVRRIEATATDIAPHYADWRNVGFALSDELGESGRDYFHRLSRFYTGYSTAETDKKYDKCLKAKGHGVSIKTIFHLAKQAGIEIGISKKSPISPISPSGETGESGETADEIPAVNLPNFPDGIFEKLPYFFQRIVANANSDEDKDILLLGSIVTLSACLPNIYGIYAQKKVGANLYLFISAQASAGKGRLPFCRKLVEPIHKSLKEQSLKERERYEMELAEYAQAKKDKTSIEKPKEPPFKMLIIPANNSSTGVFQILNDNNGVGLMFETEGDTLSQTFKSDYGNYSDGFRQAFHHEIISYNRRQNREYVEIERPQLSAVLSGTPGQIATLIPSAENGLFSRFIFYYMNIRPEWIDVFAGSNDESLDDYFGHLGNRFFEFYKILQAQEEPMRFSLTLNQQKDFNKTFDQTQTKAICIQGVDYVASVRRLGLITFRIAMILTTIRLMDNGSLSCGEGGGRGSILICSDDDYHTAMEIAKVLNVHASMVYDQLPTNKTTVKLPNLKQQFYDKLPDTFNRQTYLDCSAKLDIVPKTAEKQIASFIKAGILQREAQNLYKKQSNE
jgi:hypothetical protein